jgi:cytochrome P450
MSTSVEAIANDFSYDPFSPVVMNDPLPFYRVLRDRYPVYYIAEYDTYFLSRFADVWRFLSITDGTFIGSEATLPTPAMLRRKNHGQVRPAPTDVISSMSFFGSPIYEQLRQAHTRPFRPNAVLALEDFIRAQARERLDILVPRGRFDLTQQYGGIVSAAVQCHLFRIPLAEAKYVLDVINAGSITDPVTGGNDFAATKDRICEIVEPIVRARRKEGPDGSFPLVDPMFDLRIDGRALSDRDIAAVIGGEILGGTETVPKVAAHGLWELRRRPGQMRAVRSDLAANAGTAFKEMARYCGPAQWFLRTAHKPAVIGGVPVAVGQRVAYLVPSAARDEREYGPDAEDFRWDRDIRRWVNFGRGQHFCVGYHLALLEGRILVEEFLRRVPEFQVIEADAVRLPSNFQWGWNRLPITVPITD